MATPPHLHLRDPSAADTLAAKANSPTSRRRRACAIRPMRSSAASSRRSTRSPRMPQRSDQGDPDVGAAGAALMGMGRPAERSGGGSRPGLPSSATCATRRCRLDANSLASSTLATIREAAMDLAERARSVAPERDRRTHRRPPTRSTRARSVPGCDGLGAQAARPAADSVSETVADAWNSLRDQAPGRRQVEAAVRGRSELRRDEPARAALGIAAAAPC